MIRRTLMKRNRELADFEVDPATGEARILDAPEAAEDRFSSAELTDMITRRALSFRRADIQDILRSCGALSPTHLAFMGKGLSLSDQYWYRAPGSTERWEDVNFFDNEWDPGFGAAVLSRDYARLASCSPNVPDVTTSGQIIKTWERNDDGVFLIKESLLPDGADLQAVKLAADLCSLLFSKEHYVPVDIVERRGRPCTASPLMLAPDEEFADGNRLCALTGMGEGFTTALGSYAQQELFQNRIRIYEAIGIRDACAHVARMACLSSLALLPNFHAANIGAIRKAGTDAWRAAPIFDYDGSFGFRDDFRDMEISCANPLASILVCASCFSFLDPSWDWSWYDPQAFEGFEERIVEAFAPYHSLPSNFGTLVAGIFAMQREYVNGVASEQA